MNIEEYISSGVLELYALGGLSAEEVQEVEAMAQQHPHVRQEIEQIYETLEALATNGAIAPRPALKDSILQNIAASEGVMWEDDAAEAATTIATEAEPFVQPPPPEVPFPPATPNPEPPPPAKPANVLELRPQQALPAPVAFPASRRYLLAASIVFALLGLGAAAYMGYQWQTTKEDLAHTINRNQQLVQEYNTLKNRMNRVVADMVQLKDPKNQVVTLAGLEAAPSAIAMVHWNPATGDVALSVEGLPAPPEDKQYQLWALADGKPIDAGVFDLADQPEALHHMKKIDRAEAFAITLEPRGGMPTPTGAMYVLGKMKA
ncbi:MAG: hypothetical protein DYG96_07945 [Chlorobi bacterium CHB2]|nr:hypothetical protein [Chlorobi bacterium CHB2]